MKRFTPLFILSACLISFTAVGEPEDSAKHRLQYPSNIKFNITSSVEFSPSLVMAYERTVKPYQTFQVMGGYITFPFLLRDLPDSISLVESRSSSGYRIGGEYRFYFKKENLHQAPRGLYWGPFVDYFYFQNKRVITVTDTSFATGELDFTSKLGVLQGGINIGYQFVIKKRLSIDLTMFGPALAFYGAKLKLDGDFDINEENEYLQGLYDYLISNFPIIGELVEYKEVDSNGRANLFYAGFRYSICVGFRF
jgi:hypothetical protein